MGINKNKLYRSSNGLDMVESSPLNWRVESTYSDGSGPKYYCIYVGDFSEGHNCLYQDGILNITYSFLSSEDPTIKFSVDSLEEAGEIVEKLAKGIDIDLSNTIYKIK